MRFNQLESHKQSNNMVNVNFCLPKDNKLDKQLDFKLRDFSHPTKQDQKATFHRPWDEENNRDKTKTKITSPLVEAELKIIKWRL